jgi:hypothetical protein
MVSLLLGLLWVKVPVRKVKDMLRSIQWKGRKTRMIALLFLFVMASYGHRPGAMAADPDPLRVVRCDIQHGSCTGEISGVTVTLDILPKPVKAMRDLKFQVTVSGAKPVRASHIDLGMPGMNMGPNRVELRPVKGHVFEGQGIIVRCASGSRTWKATVTLPQTGEVEFVFDVIY